MTDPVIAAVCADLARRSEVGIAKYGTTLARKDVDLRGWLQHAYEECLDQAAYLKRAMMELSVQRQPDLPDKSPANHPQHCHHCGMHGVD